MIDASPSLAPSRALFRARGPIAALLLGLALGPACSKETPTPQATAPASAPAAASTASVGDLPDRDPALAHKLVADGAVLLDVRTGEEYAGRHLNGAVNIPVGDLQSRIGEVEKLSGSHKDKPIVVYCQSGSRADKAKATLRAAGYTQVTNLGGIDDWDRK